MPEASSLREDCPGEVTFELTLERTLITWKKREKHVPRRGNNKDKVPEARKRMFGPFKEKNKFSRSSRDGGR